jgi:ATP-dependent helicase/nuclease subunit A
MRSSVVPRSANVATDESLIERDIRARETALDVSRSFIVQAPAGSGKTELLIQRYLCLLAIVDSPEEVLAITFTRKAAFEMQLRVLAALRKAYEGREGESDHERKTLAYARAVLARDEEHDWRLLDSPGRMRIETVDAFSAGIARSLPLSSGLGGAGSTAADAEVDQVYRDAAAATLDYLAAGEGPGESVERVMRHLDNNAGLYLSYVSRMLASREQWLEITGSGAMTDVAADTARRQLERNVEDVIRRQLEVLQALLPPVCFDELPSLLEYAGSNLAAAGATESPLAALAGVGRIPSTEPNDRDGWRAVADLLLTKQGEWRKSITKNEGFPAGSKAVKQRLFDLIDDLHRIDDLREALHRTRSLPSPRYSDEQWAVLVALFELLPLAVGELRRLFGERGVTDHTEIALSAGRALGSSDEPGEVALMLDYQVQHLLVDEMQDTSISQYELLKKLTAGWTPDDGRTVFCVGDPMQSIYRFRDAEVGEFLLARKRGIGSIELEPLTLRRNFRSGEHLVHWFNTVFSQVMPLKDDVAVGAISYADSAPVEERANQGEHRVYPLFGADTDTEAACTRDIIRRCLEENPDDQVAVLVRGRSQLSTLLPLLRREGLEYQAVEIDRLTDLPEIIELVALTRALAHHGDRLAWLALLRSPWTGLCWADLHALTRNDVTSSVAELLQDAERQSAMSQDGRRRAERLLAALMPFIERNLTESFRDIVEGAWHALGGPALLTDGEQLDNVYRYFDTLDRIAVAGTLDDVRELESRLDTERVSSNVGSACRLHVMTMHKAKGLEFDHVVLHGLGRVTRGSTREVLNWLYLPDEAGRGEMLISPVGPRAELDNDPLHQFIEATEREKDRMEQDRLLYVACTRAMKSLHLVGHTGVSADGERLNRPDSRSLLSRLWRAVEPLYEEAFQSWVETGDATAEESSGLALPRLRRFTAPWQAPQPDIVVVPERAIAEDSRGDDKPVEFDWVGSITRHTGTIVHRWLQRLGDGRLEISADDLSRLRPVSRRWAASLGVSSDDVDTVCDQSENALRGILTDDKGRWVLFGAGACELPLSGILDGRVESVVLDRVRIDDDGTHWIVDYKTSLHEGGDLARFLRQESDRYRPQLARYAAIYGELVEAPVRTALYFPLLQTFLEVEVGS